MKVRRPVVIAALFTATALAVAACGEDSTSSGATTTKAPTSQQTTSTAPSSSSNEAATVVDVAVASPDHTILVAAVKQAGLAGTLTGAGPFTVLAPTDEAFAAAAQKLGVTKEQLLANPALGDILKYHVIPGKVMSSDLEPGAVTTVQGEPVTVAVTGGATFNGAKVVKADIPAGNGVVHVIDAVLLPPSVASALGVG